LSISVSLFQAKNDLGLRYLILKIKDFALGTKDVIEFNCLIEELFKFGLGTPESRNSSIDIYVLVSNVTAL